MGQCENVVGPVLAAVRASVRLRRLTPTNRVLTLVHTRLGRSVDLAVHPGRLMEEHGPSARRTSYRICKVAFRHILRDGLFDRYVVVAHQGVVIEEQKRPLPLRLFELPRLRLVSGGPGFLPICFGRSGRRSSGRGSRA